MQMKSELVFDVNAQKTGIVIRISEPEGEIGAWQMEAPELDQHIRALANFRALLIEPVTPDLDEGARIEDAIMDPRIKLSGRLSDQRLLVAYRHPGFGWLGFGMRREAVEALIPQLEGWLKQLSSR